MGGVSAVHTPAGCLLWITGFPGAGKTTIGRAVHAELKRRCDNVVLVDGDVVRQVCGNDLGYTPPERLQNAYRIARLCAMLTGQGMHVVCCTVSLHHEIHRFNREHNPRYSEVWVRADNATLRQRDQKGLYSAKRDDGASVDLVGVDHPGEPPEHPHVTLDNSGSGADVDAAVAGVLQAAGL